MSALALLLMRHAKSDWSRPGLTDHERPLNPRGRRDAPRMGRFLRENGLTPAAALCSTALRARETAEAVLRAAGAESVPVRWSRGLYGAAPGEIFRQVREAAAELGGSASPLLVVAHNPGMEDLAARCGRGQREEGPGGVAAPFPTAALAVVRCPVASWEDLPAPEETTVTRSVRPRDLEE